MNKDRYPTRTFTQVQGEQLLQKRTRSQTHKKGAVADKQQDKSLLFGHENLIQKKQKNELNGDLVNMSPRRVKNGYNAYEQNAQIYKTNPRLTSSRNCNLSPTSKAKKKMINKQQDQQPPMQSMSMPQVPQNDMNRQQWTQQMMTQQYNPMANQMAMMPSVGQMPTVSVSYGMNSIGGGMNGIPQVNPMQQQIDALQKQIMQLCQMTQMQAQVAQLQNHAQTYHQSYPQSTPLEHQAQMMASAATAQDNSPEAQKENQNIQNQHRHTPSGSRQKSLQNSPQNRQSKQMSPVKNYQGNNKGKAKNQWANQVQHQGVQKQAKGHKKHEVVPEISVKVTRSSKAQEAKILQEEKIAHQKSSAKNAGNHLKPPENTSILKQRKDSPQRQKSNSPQRSPVRNRGFDQRKTRQAVQVSQKPVQQVPTQVSLRRSARLQLDQKSDQKQQQQQDQKPSKASNSPKRSQVVEANVATNRTLRSSQQQQQQLLQRESQNTSLMQTPVRITRASQKSQLTQNENQASQKSKSPPKESSKILQNLKNDLRKVTESHLAQIERKKRREGKYGHQSKRHGTLQQQYNSEDDEEDTDEKQDQYVRRTSRRRGTPTKDEQLLFGEQASLQDQAETQKDSSQVQDTFYENQNPLRPNKKAYEPQTEIVRFNDVNNLETHDIQKKEKMGGASDYQKDVYTDDEQDDKEVNMQLEKEKEKKEVQVLDWKKLKDMTILFGMSQTEVDDIAKKQEEELRRQHDDEILFGESNNDGYQKLSHSHNTSIIRSSQPKHVENKIPTPRSQILIEQSQSEVIVQQSYKQSASQLEEKDASQNYESANNCNEVQAPPSQPVEIVENAMSSNNNSQRQQVQDQQVQQQFADEQDATQSEPEVKDQQGDQEASIKPVEQVRQLNKDDEKMLFDDQPMSPDEDEQLPLRSEDLIAPRAQEEKEMPILAPQHDYYQKQMSPAKVVQNSQNQHQNAAPEPCEAPYTKKIQPPVPSNDDQMEQQKLELQRQIEELKKQIEQQKQAACLHQAQIIDQQDEEMVEDEDADEQPSLNQQDDQIQNEEDLYSAQASQDLPSQDQNTMPIEKALPQEIPQDLPLPASYNLLVSFQKHVDQCLMYLQMRQQTPIFTNLKPMVESQSGRQFNISHVRQMLTIQPEFYNHTWQMKFGNIELVLSIPSNIEEVLAGQAASDKSFEGSLNSQLKQKRNATFKNEVIKRAIKIFDDSTNVMQHHYDIYQHQKWPADFDYETRLGDIPLADLKDQPKMQYKTNMNQFIEQIDTEAKVKIAIEEAESKNRILNQSANFENGQHGGQQQQQQPNEDFSDYTSDEANKEEDARGCISQATMNAIQLKERIVTEAKQMNEKAMEKQDSQKNIDRLLKLSEQIKQIFNIHIGSQMYFSRLMVQLQDGQRGHFISKDNLKEQIIALSKVFPQWMQIISTHNGTMVKIHKHLNLQGYHFKKQIEAFYEKKAQQKQREQVQKPNMLQGVQQSQESHNRQAKSLPPPTNSVYKQFENNQDLSNTKTLSNRSQSLIDNMQGSSGAGAHNQQQQSRQTSSAFQPFQKKPSIASSSHMQTSHLPSSNQQQNEQFTDQKSSTVRSISPESLQKQSNIMNQMKIKNQYDQVYRQQDNNQQNQDKIITTQNERPTPKPQPQQLNPGPQAATMTNLSSSGTFLSGNNASGTSGNGQSGLSGAEHSAPNSLKNSNGAGAMQQQVPQQQPVQQLAKQCNMVAGNAYDQIQRLYQNDSNSKRQGFQPFARKESDQFAQHSMQKNQNAGAHNPSKYISPLKEQHQNASNQLYGQNSEHQMSGFGNIITGMNQESSSSQMLCPNSGFNGNLRGSPAEHGRGMSGLANLGGLSNMGIQFGNDLYPGMSNSFSNGNQYGEGTKNSNDPSSLFFDGKYQSRNQFSSNTGQNYYQR